MVEVVPGERSEVLRRRDDRACVFLLADGFCRVHAEHGSAAKPSVCRRFPYFPRRVGGEVRLHLSRCCPSVRDGFGGPPSGEDLDEAVRGAPFGRDVEAGPVALAGLRTVPWDDYLRLERLVVALLEDERWRLPEGIAAAGLLVGRAVAADRVPEEVDDAETLDLVSEAIARRRPIRALYRYITSTALGTSERERLWGRAALVGKVLSGRGRVWIPTLGIEAPVADVPRILWPRRDRDFERPLRRLLASHVRHGFLAAVGEVETGFRLVAAAYGLVRWYGRATAAAIGREVIHPDDLGRGMHAVEYHFLLHRTWRRDALHHRLIRGYVRNFLFHPSFVDSMLYV